MSNLFTGNVSPEGFFSEGSITYHQAAGTKTSLPIPVRFFEKITIKPVGGTSTRARTIEILRDGSKRWYGNFSVSDAAPMTEITYIPREDVAFIQVYYKNVNDTATGLFVVGVGNTYTEGVVNLLQKDSFLTKLASLNEPIYRGTLELDLDQKSERYWVLDRKTSQLIYHGATKHYLPVVVPEKYAKTDKLCVLMFDDSGEFNIAAADNVEATLFDANE
ncbi:hypothetical protein D5018_03985 [Parashewanella curva]|uniref:Uncharacterized protein n=1 Tax=Parashewanella curva TaxID=2338552 RepID=A0A3L8Q1Y1_9GAMM|nr:hypothetical protein [Parashewanella curva]RLV61009.1 hypothetical protein D5018_03985 [Parashewanella curva]